MAKLKELRKKIDKELGIIDTEGSAGVDSPKGQKK
jgi:hypothetical protein